jgi:prolyl oligopeptidase
MNYPAARRQDLVELIHGHEVADPYRWLEDPDSEPTQTWLTAEDELCRTYLDALPGRAWLRERLWANLPGFVSAPYVIGTRQFFLRREPEQDHAVLWVREADGSERALIDPSELSPDHTTTLDSWVPSLDGERIAYDLSEGGDEESALRVLDVATGEVVDGPIDRTRYGSVAWLPGGAAFFYVRRPQLDDPFNRRVWLHRVGTDPDADDALVFGEREGVDKTAYLGLDLSLDGRWLTVSVNLGTAPRNDVYLADLGTSPPERPAWRPIFADCDAQLSAGVGPDGRLYCFTDLDAPRGRLAVTDPERPELEHWRDLLPEDPEGGVLAGFALTRDAVVALRSRHAVSEIAVHDRETGAFRYPVNLPGLGAADLTTRPELGHDVWIGYTDHVTPYRILHLDLARAGPATQPAVWATPPGAVEPPPVRSEQVTYPSRDGTEIRMFVIAPPVLPSGPQPTILYGYGGFNVPMTPAYSSGILAWVEAGGTYAIANLRGGSEEGEEWHRAGMRANKQNVFDDFAAAAGWLAGQGITDRDLLGISGGSNGGLLVGATIAQHPDLVAAAVCSAPLLDMVRYERFGLGETWNDEYGRADDPTEFGWLYGYSPYHHVVEGRVVERTAYPAVLFTVFDRDTRVDPLHARKLAAALQHGSSSDPSRRPILFRREANVGHGARSVGRTIELSVDTLSFLAAQLGLGLPG